MGKWAQYAKRGSAQTFGSVAAPGPSGGDWTIGTPTTTTIPVTRVAPVPAGATQMLWRAIRNSDGVVVAAYNNVVSGLVTGTQYRIQAAWFNAIAQQVSDNSPSTLVTTA